MKTIEKIIDWLIYVVGIAAITFFLVSCSSEKNDWDASGVFETTEVIVSAEASGRIEKFNILEGDNLSKEQTIGYIDTTQLYLQKMQLIANNRAMLSKKISVPRQIASIGEQIATQRKEKERFEALVKSNAGNQKQVDDIESAINVLEKQLTAQTEVLEQSNRGVSDQSSSIDIQIAQIEDMLAKSVIKSPISGTVLIKYAEQGELASQGRALYKVANTSEMYLRAYITADQITRCKLGDKVTVFSDMGENDRKEYEGKITWLSDQAEFTPKTIQTRDERSNLVYAIKVLVLNDGFIKRGMYGELKLLN